MRIFEVAYREPPLCVVVSLNEKKKDFPHPSFSAYVPIYRSVCCNICTYIAHKTITVSTFQRTITTYTVASLSIERLQENNIIEITSFIHCSLAFVPRTTTHTHASYIHIGCKMPIGIVQMYTSHLYIYSTIDALCI